MTNDISSKIKHCERIIQYQERAIQVLKRQLEDLQEVYTLLINYKKKLEPE